mgnify:CR=1 FL=1|tara:strand:+ start:13145 stop:13432 length:288 start_codon:yes stop_codon:yes gene_type:complete
MKELLKKSKSKRVLKKPICPNCKEKYNLYVANERDIDGEFYKYGMFHGNKMCPFGLITYQKTVDKCVDSINNHMKKEFRLQAYGNKLGKVKKRIY